MKYACITLYQREFAVRLMCRVLEVAPSGFYAWRSAPPSAHAIADERLLLHVRGAHRDGGNYGAPRVHRDLRDAGLHVGKKRVARLMRSDGLVGCAVASPCPHTTDSTHAYPIAQNLLARRFAVFDANGVAALNRAWVSDITYVPTREGWLYSRSPG